MALLPPATSLTSRCVFAPGEAVFMPRHFYCGSFRTNLSLFLSSSFFTASLAFPLRLLLIYRVYVGFGDLPVSGTPRRLRAILILRVFCFLHLLLYFLFSRNTQCGVLLRGLQMLG